MANDNVNEIKVRLNGVEELFAEPQADPFDPGSRYRTGMEELLDQMHGLRGGAMRVVVDLPPDAVEPGLQERAAAAFKRYCRAKVDELERLLKDHWRQTRRQLATAAVVFLAIFAAAVMVVAAENLPTYVQTLVLFCLGVFGYATLWGPADLVLYAWRPYQEDLRRHRCLAEAQVVVRSQD